MTPRSTQPPLITCIGEPLVVLTAQLGPLELAETFTRGPGGAELNVATTIASLGLPTALITRVGAEGFGRYIVDHLVASGVDVSAVIVDPARQTGLYVKQRGGGTGHPHDLADTESRWLYYRRDSAASALSVHDLGLHAVDDVLSRTQLLHVTGITPALSETTRRTVDHLLGGDYRCSFDVNYRPGLWPSTDLAADTLAACVRASDIAFMGLDEANAAFNTATPAEIRAAFPEPEYLVVKNDAHHVTGFHEGTAVEVPALKVEVHEKIGAGDAFASGFLVGITRGEPVDRALRLAHICAATTLTSAADASAPSREVIERFLSLPDEQWSTTEFELGQP
ncbi:MAG: 2-dehydro-3-deoxygluconokinase [Mycobacterium sp.]|nr:2-dehydro-3-deoxygluconokinase [Mycobacterium sp.]